MDAFGAHLLGLLEHSCLIAKFRHKTMATKLEKFDRRLAAARKFERIMKYLSLFGIGFALWINYLWDLALTELETARKSWFVKLFMGSNLKFLPALKFLNDFYFILFLTFTAWLVYWAYMDTYVQTAHGENTWSFGKKVRYGILVNGITFVALWFSTQLMLSHSK